MEIYHLITNWYFTAPIESVWEELIDAKSWPSWWPCWRKLKFHGSESKLRLGTIAYNEVKGQLPYSLRFSNEVTLIQEPYLIENKSSGDLVGKGKTVLEQRDDGTVVTIYWDVATSNPIFNLLGKLPFVRAMIEKNHDYVMDDGFRGLKQRLEQRQFSSEQA
jgi:uncharacterized protein YndB with AHSA1/START domain